MSTPEITQLLHAWRDGNRSVENELVARIYPVLRALSVDQLRRNRAGGATMRATELVNEAYERLQRQQQVDWQNREHFFAIAGTVIRRVFVDHLRERGKLKRGGGAVMLALDHDIDDIPQPPDGIDWLALDQALAELERIEPNCVKIVEMRIFAGLDGDQIAQALGVSTATYGRLWRFARAFLSERLG